MANWRPDPSFYPSPDTAGKAQAETLAYVALMSPDPSTPDAIGVLDLDPGSSRYGQVTDRVDMPVPGDELHHFGWNACSSCLCPYAPHPHMERRYLIVPGLRSSRISVGQRLTVKAPASAGDSGGQYKVRSGDTLEVIARRFNCSVADLIAWNNLRSSRINTGDVLTVRAESSSNRGD